MEQTTLTIRLPLDPIKGAERYAEQHQTSVTQLIELDLRQLVAQEILLGHAPIGRYLSGILPSDASMDEYHAYLEEKHGPPSAISPGADERKA
jgi:hypothetical protein